MPNKSLALTALVCVFALAPALDAHAGEWSAVINGRSVHLGASESWNENNLGLGVEYQFATETRWKRLLMVNGLRDSADKMSYMAGAGLHRNVFQTTNLADLYVDVGINAFLMTRDDVNDNRPFPGALPSLTIGNRYAGFNLTYLPRKAVEKLYSAQMADEGVSGIIYLQFKLSATALGFGGD